jgi:hypothetical protein
MALQKKTLRCQIIFFADNLSATLQLQKMLFSYFYIIYYWFILPKNFTRHNAKALGGHPSGSNLDTGQKQKTPLSRRPCFCAGSWTMF